MTAPRDVAEVVSEELLLLRRKVQDLLFDGPRPLPDAHDAYVSALIGHLFATLMTKVGLGGVQIDKSPEGLASALNVFSKKMGAVAENLDPSAEYKIQIFRRERSS